MVRVISALAIAFALYALWIVARPDLLRLVQGTRSVRGRVVEHVGSADGFVPIYAFQDGARPCRVPGATAHAQPTPPLGSECVLSYPKKRPDLAREPAPLMRSILYAGFAAWILFFADLGFG